MRLAMKTDADGDTLWTRIFDWGEWPITSRAKSVQQTVDGGYIITGHAGNELVPIKTDSQGNAVPYGE